MTPCYLGVDIGTGGAKAVAFDGAGRQLALAAREYPLLVPREGWAELDAGQVLDACCAAIAEVAGRLPAGAIRGLGISSQGEAFTPVDAQGRLLGHAMVSSDMRAVPYVTSFPAAFGEDRLYRLTGHTAHPMFSLFKLLWLRDHQPELWQRAARFLCFEELLQARLGLAPQPGWPLAGRTMLFDVTRHCWDPDILAAVGLRAEQLGTPVASGTVVGTIPAAIAAPLGLGEGVIVVAGGHDQVCGALGAGITAPGQAMYATGTVECITPAFANAVFTDELRRSNLCTYDHTAPGRYATVAFSLTGGNVLRWFRDEFGAAEVARAQATGGSPYELLLAALPEEPTRLLALPYFTPSGTPYFDTRVAGAILGWRLSSTRGDMLRALLEGVAFEMRLNLDLLERSGCPIAELRAIGGGARSPRWNQLKADVLGKPLTTLDVTEAGCLGMAMLAAAAVTGTPVTTLAAQWVRPVATVTPRPAWQEWYARRFADYRELYPALRRLHLFSGE
jgi:xylulokinase